MFEPVRFIEADVMISVGDKARVTKGHPIGYEDIITRAYLAAGGGITYQLGYDFVQCRLGEFEIIERVSGTQYRVGDVVLYSRAPGEPPRECTVLEVQHKKGFGALEPSIAYYIRAGYADFRMVYPHELTPVTYSLF